MASSGGTSTPLAFLLAIRYQHNIKFHKKQERISQIQVKKLFLH